MPILLGNFLYFLFELRTELSSPRLERAYRFKRKRMKI